SIQAPFRLPYNEDIFFKHIYEARLRRENFFVMESSGKELEETYHYMLNLPGVKKYFDDALDSGFSIPKFQITHCAFFSHGYVMFITYESCPEMWDIFKRFAKVFEQTYTRFLDLQKAEAQAREAQIEAALEKVRSRSLAMHKSDELESVVSVVFEKLRDLNVLFDGGVGIFIFTEGSKDSIIWVASPEHLSSPSCQYLPYEEATFANNPLHSDLWIAREKGIDFYVKSYSFEEKNIHFNYVFEHNDYEHLPAEVRSWILARDSYSHSVALARNSAIVVNSWTGQLLSENDNDILKRFARVFEQAYIRFLDLQKAEAQAREAHIEAALEKVRSRSLAMHKSDELEVVVSAVFERLHELNVVFDGGVGIFIFTEGAKDSVIWVASPDHFSTASCLNLPYEEANFMNNSMLSDMWTAREKGIDFYVRSYSFEDKNIYFKYLFKHNDYEHMPADVRNWILAAESYTHSVALARNSAIVVNSWTGQLLSENENEILKRFARVFEQAYIRFLDLQKAETQAREATIEAALERVRGRAMAMHNSNDLSFTASIVFTELKKLGIDPKRSGVAMLSKDSKKAPLFAATISSQNDALELVGEFDMTAHPCLMMQYESWLKKEVFFPVLKGEELKSYYATLLSELPLLDRREDQFEQVEYGYYFPFSEGIFYAWTEKPFRENDIKILNRFNSIIDLTFRRYVELQKSEANARDAVRSASLDRVRAETASMRTTADLEKITPLIWNELTTLGIPFIRSGVFIMDEEHQLMHTYLSTPDGKAIASFRQQYNASAETARIITRWRERKIYEQHWDEAQLIEYTKGLVEQGAITSGEKFLTENRPTDLYLHFLPFLQGMLYVGNTSRLSDNELDLVQNLADAFSTAYARYEDFKKLESAKQQVEKTLVDLKQTQAQLVQSEKMASLGELTAGIAHEIQNPLNFVNNFSDVSNELLEEMKTEMEKGNTGEAVAIVQNLKQNLEKILHHGQRADAIVKGMLQHSRETTGQKELIDINALADEYLRLSYQGLRAKDKSFQTSLNPDFDKSLDKINIIPQDIGRVLLNLYNNAFYAVSEKQKKEVQGYSPAVSVATKKIGDKVEISVKDNGFGIPEKVREKIFQPFFTTKPTGQGTGLGLSLSYDIIKSHGGEIKVETKEGEGAEFIVQLPV
ncbi:MAG: sensor histidine kinase, partial [Chitinophagales bacterium]